LDCFCGEEEKLEQSLQKRILQKQEEEEEEEAEEEERKNATWEIRVG